MVKTALKHLLLLLSFNVWLSGPTIATETSEVHVHQLKTAYLYHFAELTEWPASSAVTICLRGESQLKNYLPVLEGQQIGDKAVHIKLIGATVPGPGHCHILFSSENSDPPEFLKLQARSEHMLLVGDAEDFARNGGMVQFVLRDDKLKLIVNLAAVKDAGLKLSSKLLRMAEILE